MSQGRGSCCSSTRWASTTAPGRVGVPQGRQRRVHAGARARRESFGAEIRLEAPVASVITKDGRATGVVLKDGTEFHAPIVVSALDPRRTFLELVDRASCRTTSSTTIRRYRFRGTSAKVNFALDGLPSTRPAGRDGPVPRLHQHRAVDGVPRARLRRGEVRLVLAPAVHRLRDPVDDRPRHGAARQARDVVLRPVRAVRAARERLGRASASTWATDPGTLESFFPGFGDLVLQREVVTPLDIEQVAGLTEGNIFHGELLAPQMYFFRPRAGPCDARRGDCQQRRSRRITVARALTAGVAAPRALA